MARSPESGGGRFEKLGKGYEYLQYGQGAAFLGGAAVANSVLASPEVAGVLTGLAVANFAWGGIVRFLRTGGFSNTSNKQARLAF